MKEKPSQPPALAFGHAWDYAPSPESTPVPLRKHYDPFIDGEFVPSAEGNAFDTINPATGKPLATISTAGSADLDRAVKAARRAFDGPVWVPSLPRNAGSISSASPG